MMIRIKIWDRGERGGVDIKTFKTVEITERDYRKMRAVIKAADKFRRSPVNNNYHEGCALSEAVFKLEDSK